MKNLLKIKSVDSWVNVHVLASTSVPFTLTTVQVPNLALIHTKRITVWLAHCWYARPVASLGFAQVPPLCVRHFKHFKIKSKKIKISHVRILHCCGTASPWCGYGFDLSPWCGSVFLFVIWFGSGSDFSHFADPDSDPDPSFKKRLKALKKC